MLLEETFSCILRAVACFPSSVNRKQLVMFGQEMQNGLLASVETIKNQLEVK